MGATVGVDAVRVAVDCEAKDAKRSVFSERTTTATVTTTTISLLRGVERPHNTLRTMETQLAATTL